jgi:hypothetical protein
MVRTRSSTADLAIRRQSADRIPLLFELAAEAPRDRLGLGLPHAAVRDAADHLHPLRVRGARIQHLAELGEDQDAADYHRLPTHPQ